MSFDITLFQSRATILRWLGKASVAGLLISGIAQAQQSSIASVSATTPFIDAASRSPSTPGIDYPLLRASRDDSLQYALEQSLAELGLAETISDQHLAVALVDITNPRQPRTAEVNGDEMFYAASLPKIGILLGAFQRIANGEIAADQDTLTQLTKMIRVSSNSAATKMLNRVGKQYLAELLQSEPYKLYDPEFNGGLWVGKEYAKSNTWKRDPLHNISHGATAMQTARFYYLLATGRLVSSEYSQQMKKIMGNPAIKHKFVLGLHDRPDARIFRKSGSWRNYHADSALIEHAGKRYIAVALSDDVHGGKWMSRMIASFDDIILGQDTNPTRVADSSH